MKLFVLYTMFLQVIVFIWENSNTFWVHTVGFITKIVTQDFLTLRSKASRNKTSARVLRSLFCALNTLREIISIRFIMMRKVYIYFLMPGRSQETTYAFIRQRQTTSSPLRQDDWRTNTSTNTMHISHWYEEYFAIKY